MDGTADNPLFDTTPASPSPAPDEPTFADITGTIIAMASARHHQLDDTYDALRQVWVTDRPHPHGFVLAVSLVHMADVYATQVLAHLGSDTVTSVDDTDGTSGLLLPVPSSHRPIARTSRLFATAISERRLQAAENLYDQHPPAKLVDVLIDELLTIIQLAAACTEGDVNDKLRNLGLAAADS